VAVEEVPVNVSRSTMRDEAIETPSRADLGVRARKAAAWALLDKGVTRALTTIVFIVLARLLTPRDFGLVVLALVVRYFLGVFLDQGFTEAIIQKANLGRRSVDTAFWTAIATGSLLTLVTFALAPFIASEILGNEAVTPLLRVLAFSLLLTAASSTQSALLARQLAFRELAVRRIVAQLVAGAAALTAALLGAGAWSLVIQTMLQGAVGAALLWHFSDWRPAFRFHMPSFRFLAVFGISMVGIDVLNVVQQQADNFLVGRTLGVAALGIYAIGFRFYFVVVDITMSSMSAVALSTFARVQDELELAGRMFVSASRLTTLVALPFFAGMAIVAPEMISVLVGDKWAAAAPVLRALCPSGLILCLSYLDRSLIVSVGRPGLALKLTAFGVGLRLIGYIVGVQFGVLGVAVGLSVTSIVFWPCRLLVLRTLTRVSLTMYARRLVPAVVATGVMSAALLPLRAVLGEAALGPLLAEVVVGAAVYGISIALIDRSSIHDLIGLVRPRAPARGGVQAR
jgi:PST family polysaccharide transporter